jgi:glycosyltransferase involved in cell wall biosynthesis
VTEPARPRVSIGLPVYNGERYLQAALDSILGQTFEDFELVIADNASTDATETICRTAAASDQRIRYHRNETNIGGHPNHNRVFDLSVGEYFRWAAYDDLLAPDFLKHCVAVLDEDPDVVLCFSLFDTIDQDGHVVGLSDPPPPVLKGDTPHERLREFWHWPSVHQVIYGLIRREALLRIPPMGIWYGADRATLLDLALLGRFERVDLPLFLHREHQLRSQYVDKKSYWSPAGSSGPTQFGYWRRLGYACRMVRRHSFPLREQLAIIRVSVLYGIRRTPHWLPELIRELWAGVRYGLSRAIRSVARRA